MALLSSGTSVTSRYTHFCYRTAVFSYVRHTKNIVTKRQSQLTKSVVHTVVSDGHVVTFGDSVVTFLNDFLHS
jgi:hypothetical protein